MQQSVALDRESFGSEPEVVNGRRPTARESIETTLAFPDISFREFKQLPYTFQKAIIARNRIVNTDTYNRTMDELVGRLQAKESLVEGRVTEREQGQATFTLQMRRPPFGYLVACGVEDLIEELTLIPINRAELNFAKEYYKTTRVPFFNEKMWIDVIEKYGGKLPFEIRGVRDGTVLLPGETLLTVRGPEELIAHFEHVFHRDFYSTLVATGAHALLQIIGDSSRFIEVGKRGAVTEEQHLQALKAMHVGGGFTFTSNDAGPALLPLKDIGTIGHRYVQRFSNEEQAFRHEIEELDVPVLLIDLIESYRGIDLALTLKQEYRDTGKAILVRLDSGDILEQVRYFLRRTNALSFTDPKRDAVIVEGIDSLEEIRAIEEMIAEEFGEAGKKRVLYGAGGLLISDRTTRADASTGFKLSEYTDLERERQPTMKFSSSPGKISYPGAPRLALVNGKRVMAQLDERFDGDVVNLFEPLYMGKHFEFQRSTPEEAHRRACDQFSALQSASIVQGAELKALRAVPSPATQSKIREVQERYGLAA